MFCLYLYPKSQAQHSSLLARSVCLVHQFLDYWIRIRPIACWWSDLEPSLDKAADVKHLAQLSSRNGSYLHCYLLLKGGWMWLRLSLDETAFLSEVELSSLRSKKMEQLGDSNWEEIWKLVPRGAGGTKFRGTSSMCRSEYRVHSRKPRGAVRKKWCLPNTTATPSPSSPWLFPILVDGSPVHPVIS